MLNNKNPTHEDLGATNGLAELRASGTEILAFTDASTIAWDRGRAISRVEFLARALTLAATLPDHRYVFNFAEDRYRFALGLCASLMRGQITLLPPTRASKTLTQLRERYSDCYGLGVSAINVDMPIHQYDSASSRLAITETPKIPSNQAAVIAFTSGSTGEAQPQLKTWDALSTVGANIKKRFAFDAVNILATVPYQHMYGLETSVCLPLISRSAFSDAQPLYPADIRSALMALPSPRLLITSPIHLRAMLLAGLELPPLFAILSATAPLSHDLASAIERRFAVPVYEIYGFSEAGSVATRRTTDPAPWQLLDGLQFGVRQSDRRLELHADYLATPIAFPDLVVRCGADRLELHGRGTDIVKIAGHRASLQDLNQTLQTIEGVEDGVFLMPEDDVRPDARLLAIAVAPSRTAEEILAALQQRIDRAFLPRPLYIVSRLPRSATGKLPKEAIKQLLRECQSSGCETHSP